MKTLIKLAIVVGLIVVGVKEGTKKYEAFVYQDDVKQRVTQMMSKLQAGTPPDMQLAQSYWLQGNPLAGLGELSASLSEFRSFYRTHNLKKHQTAQIDNIVVEHTEVGDLVARVTTRVDGKKVVFSVMKDKPIKIAK